MRAAIIGAGGIALGSYACLEAVEHAPVLWSPRGAALPDTLEVTGLHEGSVPLRAENEIAAAVRGAEAVLVAVTANGFRPVMDAMAPHLEDGQLVVISSHASFAAYYLARKLVARGVSVPIAAWATTVLTSRRTAPGRVHISGRRKRLDVATLPVARAADGLATCQALFGDVLDPQADLLAIMLSNLNPPSHAANMLFNLTRAERGEDWPNYGSITGAVGRLMEALDTERLQLAARFGLTVRDVFTHFMLSHGIERQSVAEMARVVYARRPELKGPKTLETRFITEDVPFGLVPLVWLGALAGVPMPLHQAAISLFSTVMARDFAAENDLLPGLLPPGLTPDALHTLMRDGT